MGNVRWSVVVMLMFLSCGAPASRTSTRAEVPFPPANCNPFGDPGDPWCDGELTTVGIVKKRSDGTFYAVDLQRTLPGTGEPYLYFIGCSACPLREGGRYRARLDKKGNLFGILLGGAEISMFNTRADQLTLVSISTSKCLDPAPPAPSHWVAKSEDEVVCEAGADPTAWFDAEDLNVDTPTCSVGFPTGFARQFGDGTPAITVNVQLSSTYELKDPALAHELFPGLLVEAMNNATGTPRSTHPYVLADGLPHVYIQASFTQDATGDHYGMNVTVSGPKDRPTLGAGGYQASTLFTYVVPPVYTSAEKLTNAAAVGAVEMLSTPGGWNCFDGVAVPVTPRKKYCAAQPDDATLQASPLCTIE